MKTKPGKIIEQFDAEELKKDAYLNIYHSGHPSGRVEIESNRSGLILYSLELLKAADQLYDPDTQSGEKLILMTPKPNWISTESDVHINSIAYRERPSEMMIEEYSKGNKLTTFIGATGCLVILLIIVASFFVGMYAMINWFF